MRLTFIRTGIFVATLVLPCWGQEILRTHDGEDFGEPLAWVASFSDFDGDGVDDYLLAAPNGGPLSEGIVYLMSGATGTELWRVVGDVVNLGLGRAMADAGDIDGDGVHDLILGAPGDESVAEDSGRADAYSGATRVRLFSSYGGEDDEYGLSVAGIGDVDGDGYDDVAIGGRMGYADILGGPDGHLIRRHFDQPWWSAVAAVGDVDGDGVPDYVIGWPKSYINGAWTGTARVYSGADGSTIHEVHGERPYDGDGFYGDHLGHSVAGIGDVDQDGIPDFAAGAPGGLEQFASGPGFFRAYSGADAHLLFEVVGMAYNSHIGHALAGGGDVNGDDISDVLVSATGETDEISGQGAVYCLSAGTRTLLWKPLGVKTANRFGDYIAILGDLDHDGYAEFATGNRSEVHLGRVTIWRGAPGDATRICSATTNSTGRAARFDLEGPISLGSRDLTLLASSAPPGQFALFFYGASEVHDPFGNGVLCAGAPHYRLGPPVQLDATGSASRAIDFDAPPVGSGAGAWTAGSTWILQLWFRDPMAGGAMFNLSDALRLTPTP